MTVTIITQIKPIDVAAATRLAQAAGHPPDPTWTDELGGGIHEFIEAIETLYKPGTPDYVGDLDAVRVTVNGATMWSCHYGDGVGDGPSWTANAGWIEHEVPGFMHALGVQLSVSANVWGNRAAHTIP